MRGPSLFRLAKLMQHPAQHRAKLPESTSTWLRWRAVPWVTLAATLAIGWLVYQPGLPGGFLFDDFANLPALGAYGPVDNWQTFWRYVTSGTADPTGRPLSLLSFLLDARDWPADPYPFKRTSLILHLVNGGLLFVLLRQLGLALARPPFQASMAAALGMALWLLHPLMVSTTLYIVQREAMLPGTFILAGMIGYIAGRERACRGEPSGVALAASSVILGTTLAVLSKANGALLPLFILVLESTVLGSGQTIATSRTGRWFTGMRATVVVLPAALLLGYLAKVGWNGFVHGTPPHRPWTLGERLLTESRILMEYLHLLWVPRPYTAGLFNDAIEVSTGLLRPWTTLSAILAIAGMLAGALIGKRRWPAAAAAILFFFGGHLMESTVVTLELYYEHRNYIPAMLMFWPLSLLLAKCMDPTARFTAGRDLARWRTTAQFLILALPVGLALLTWMRADLWGNQRDQALLWAHQNPQSPRAQAYAAQIEMASGNHDAAITRLEPMLLRDPGDIQAALNLVGAKCSARRLTPRDLERTATALRTTRQFERMGYRWFERAIAGKHLADCPALNDSALTTLLEAAQANPHARRIRGRRQDLLNLEGRLALRQGNATQALELFNAALAEDPTPGVALAQAAMLGRTGEPGLALAHLDQLNHIPHVPSGRITNMTDVHRALLDRDGYWKTEMERLASVLKEDLESAKQGRK